MTSSAFGLELYWLPPPPDFDRSLADAANAADPAAAFDRLVGVAQTRLDFLQTMRLDKAVAKLAPSLAKAVPTLRVAVIGSATVDHLLPGIRAGALRRGLLVELMAGGYGQWRQEILLSDSRLRTFRPDAVLLCLDARSVIPDFPLGAPREEVVDAVDAGVAELASLWRVLRGELQATVIQQTPLPVHASAFGHAERLVPSSPGAVAARFDLALCEAAEKEGVLLLDMRSAALAVGADRISDPMLWHHAKQEISPAASAWAGDQGGRILAAVRGLSKKVLVLDLDNTLWGGVIGDDGLDGIVLGPGSAAGEAYAAFQSYAKLLAQRGILLAVSSKNEEAIAEAAFRDHPEMVLRREDIVAFEANWNNKPSAVQRIAAELDVGLDSLVFCDDNPVERDLMRRTLPMVAVPELPEAPEAYARCLSDAGYFEAVSFTADDAGRVRQYAARAHSRAARAEAVDLESFLRDLEMKLSVAPFRLVDLQRITQLVNKTNQFNLLTERLNDAQVKDFMADPERLAFSARLEDRFGDNGIISVLVGRLANGHGRRELHVDTWVMSCRVLGRGVEGAFLGFVARAGRQAGAECLVGRYRPTARNALVKDLYAGLGFTLVDGTDSGETTWELDLRDAPPPLPNHLELITVD